MNIISIKPEAENKFSKMSENQLLNFMVTALLESVSGRKYRMPEFRMALMHACNIKMQEIANKVAKKLNYMLFEYVEAYKGSFCIWDDLTTDEKTCLYHGCIDKFQETWSRLIDQFAL